MFCTRENPDDETGTSRLKVQPHSNGAKAATLFTPTHSTVQSGDSQPLLTAFQDSNPDKREVSFSLTVTSTQCKSGGCSAPSLAPGLESVSRSRSLAKRPGLLTRRMLISFSQQNAWIRVKWICRATSLSSSSSAASRHSTTLSGSLWAVCVVGESRVTSSPRGYPQHPPGPRDRTPWGKPKAAERGAAGWGAPHVGNILGWSGRGCHEGHVRAPLTRWEAWPPRTPRPWWCADSGLCSALPRGHPPPPYPSYTRARARGPSQPQSPRGLRPAPAPAAPRRSLPSAWVTVHLSFLQTPDTLILHNPSHAQRPCVQGEAPSAIDTLSRSKELGAATGCQLLEPHGRGGSLLPLARAWRGLGRV